MTSPRFVYKHRWSVNDAVIWDNCRFIHAAFGNRPGACRRGLHTTLATKMEVGRYAEAAAAQQQRCSVGRGGLPASSSRPKIIPNSGVSFAIWDFGWGL